MAWWKRGKPTVICLACLPAAGEQGSQIADTLGPAAADVQLDQPPAALLAASDRSIGSGADLISAPPVDPRWANTNGAMASARSGFASAGGASRVSPRPIGGTSIDAGGEASLIGESKVAKTLARLDRDDIVVLHDRRLPVPAETSITS